MTYRNNLSKKSRKPFFIFVGRDLPRLILGGAVGSVNFDPYTSHEELRSDKVIHPEYIASIIFVSGNNHNGKPVSEWLPAWRESFSQKVMLIGFSDDSKRRQPLAENGCDFVCSSEEVGAGLVYDLATLTEARYSLQKSSDQALDLLDSERLKLKSYADKWKETIPKLAQMFTIESDKIEEYQFSRELEMV